MWTKAWKPSWLITLGSNDLFAISASNSHWKVCKFWLFYVLCLPIRKLSIVVPTVRPGKTKFWVNLSFAAKFGRTVKASDSRKQVKSSLRIVTGLNWIRSSTTGNTFKGNWHLYQFLAPAGALFEIFTQSIDSFYDSFNDIFGTSCRHLGDIWDHSGTTLGPRWGHAGITLGLLWDHSGQSIHLEFLRSFL